MHISFGLVTWSVKIPCYFVFKNYWYLDSEIFIKIYDFLETLLHPVQSRVAQQKNRI